MSARSQVGTIPNVFFLVLSLGLGSFFESVQHKDFLLNQILQRMVIISKVIMHWTVLEFWRKPGMNFGGNLG